MSGCVTGDLTINRDQARRDPDTFDMDRFPSGLRILNSGCYQIHPIVGIRQLVTFPDTQSSLTKQIGLLRHRILLLELEDRRVFRLHIARSWMPNQANLAILAEALMKHDGLPHDWVSIASSLGWQLETTLSLEQFDLVNPGLERDAIRAAAMEHCLSMDESDMANANALQVKVRDIEHQMSNDLADILPRFIGRLDADALELATLWPDGLTLFRYNWLMGTDSKAQPWRIQAAKVFPALIPTLAGERGKVEQAERLLIKVIDSGRSLVQALEKNYGVRKAIARHALSIPAWLLDDARPGRLAVLLRGLSELPPERYPRAEAEWRLYFHLLYELLPSLTGRPASSSLNAAFLPAISKRGWEVTERKLNKVGLDTENAQLFREFVGAANRTLAGALVDAGKVSQTTVTTLASRVLETALISVGVVNLGPIARLWPTLVGRSRLEHKAWWDQLRGKSWPSVIGAPFECEDCKVVALTRPEELLEEGEAMGHCVGTYIQDCLNGESFIFSIRRNDGTRLATAELVFKPTAVSYQYRIGFRQIKGPGNRQVCVQGARILDTFKSHLKRDESQTLIVQVLRDIAKARKWRRHGVEAKRIDHEVEAEALRQMPDGRLRLDTLFAKAIDQLQCRCAHTDCGYSPSLA